MPINKITSTKRGKLAIAAALAAAVVGGWHALKDTSATVHPPAVILATNTLIRPWEGTELHSHWDRFGKVWDICHGETEYPVGTPIKPGMSFTMRECDDMLEARLYRDYYLPLTKKTKGYTSFPVSVQAAELSGAYNFGVGGMSGSKSARLAEQGRYREACEAQTAWNKAGGEVLLGLVNRREMGDAQRAGEAEVCVSGLLDLPRKGPTQ
ncbi:lysozyme [Rhizobium sp. L245/93]|uniref:lysozyme n=1 Tax=Rhizobium sp. L245/93 TaxID=2819998 RepID=UPI001ADD1420|nr:lysozyme [Rhizobium sp. L245/93]MBO9170893.1 lysozyme [Rhizobium sp. L245/93]